MPALIQANRQEVSRQFPVMGFTIRTGLSPAWIEVAVASDPTLFFDVNAKVKRTRSNFYSSRAAGLLPAERGECVYLIPPAVMARFTGQSRLYYALAVYSQPNFQSPEVLRTDPKAMPYIRISNTFSGNSRRLMAIPNRRMDTVSDGKGYAQNSDHASLEWGGDIAEPGEIKSIPNEKTIAPSPSVSPIKADQSVSEIQSAEAFVYNDGYDDSLWYRTQERDEYPPDLDAGDDLTPEEIPAKDVPLPKRIEVIKIPLDPGIGGHSIGQKALIAGDILLTTTQSWTAKGIRFVTGSEISHAILYVGNGNVVEAYSKDGVVLRTLAEALSGASLAVAYRVPKATAQQIQSAISFAKNQVGKEYSGWTAAVAGLLSPGTTDLVPGPSNQTFICSELVLAAYQQTGIAITYGLPERSDAGDIARVALKQKLEYVGHLIAEDTYPDYIYTHEPSAFSSTQAFMQEGEEQGFEGPILAEGDVPIVSEEQSYSMAFVESEYPLASRFAPAPPQKYTPKAERQINQIVIHITDSSAKATTNGMIRWLQRTGKDTAKVSAHYVIGRDGEVVQMVKHKDKAWHAHHANSDSIGIEHIANTTDAPPTESQYCASAAVVRWLAETYGIPLDRQHILGHAEADPKTKHKDCPNAVWDWDYYMDMVISGTCYPRSDSQQSRDFSQSHTYTAALSQQSLNVSWSDVPLVPQQNKVSCWAAAAAMIVGWRDAISISPESIATGEGPWAAYQQGLNPENVPKLATIWGLVQEPPHSYSIKDLHKLITQKGPLWIGAAVPALHVVVVVGLYGDGTADGTFVRIQDPWPVGIGRKYDLSFRQFSQVYEDAADFNSVNIQVLHVGENIDKDNISKSVQSEQQGGMRAVAGEAFKKLGEILIADALKEDVEWSFAKIAGMVHPQDGKKNSPRVGKKPEYKEIIIKGPRSYTLLGLDEIYLDTKLSFEYDGRSVGNVFMRVNKANDAVGAGLKLAIQQIPTKEYYHVPDESDDTYAVIKLYFEYAFTYTHWPRKMANIELKLLGNGMHEMKHTWLQ